MQQYLDVICSKSHQVAWYKEDLSKKIGKQGKEIEKCKKEMKVKEQKEVYRERKEA